MKRANQNPEIEQDIQRAKEKYFNSLNSPFSLHILKNYAEQGFEIQHLFGIPNIDCIEKAIAIGELEKHNIPHRLAAELVSQLNPSQARYIYTAMPKDQKGNIEWIKHVIKYGIDPLKTTSQSHSPKKAVLVVSDGNATTTPIVLLPKIDRKVLLYNFNKEFHDFFHQNIENRKLYCKIWKNFYHEYKNYLETAAIENLEIENHSNEITSITDLVLQEPLSFDEDLKSSPNLDSRTKIAEECRRRHLGKIGIKILRYSRNFEIFKDAHIIDLENLSILKKYLFCQISSLIEDLDINPRHAAIYINKLTEEQTLTLLYVDIGDEDTESKLKKEYSILKKYLVDSVLKNFNKKEISFIPVHFDKLREYHYKVMNSSFSLELLKAGVPEEYLIYKHNIDSQEKVDAILEKIKNGIKPSHAIADNPRIEATQPRVSRRAATC